MAFGLEARVPMLSVDLVDLAMRLPTDWKVNAGWTKFALRMAMRGRLPDAVIWSRRKRGFEVPQNRWIEALFPAIQEWLSELPNDSPIDGSRVIGRIKAGDAGTHWLSRCLSVALWMRFSGVQT
jgi:asparagine synthetase B (glutamine-hydrolysing)